MKKLIFIRLVLIAFIIISCSEEKKLIRKASNAVDVYDYDKAVYYYDKALANDSNSFYANAGKGIVLSEYIGKYDKAIPYLEKALKKSSSKTSLKINNDLGKSYHYIGNYPRALYFYDRTTNLNKEEDPNYDMYLSKRIADCKYALEHPEIASPELQSVKNVGPVINSDMPEYGPVYTNGELIFTSKRKDTPKEKKNGLDRRYFESIYISKLSGETFSPPRRYTLPDYGSHSKYKKGGESVVSASADGKTLYVFRRGQLYEANLNDSTKEEHKMSNKINFSHLQEHAFASSDGKMLFFTSESDIGRGGTDIYKSIKDENGKWSDPQLLPYEINTSYNEDAPFLTEDGTLFFSSNGLPGYGGYDVYKTHLENGHWTTPVNLGQPINTPADDIYFALNPNSTNGFYSSGRNGGFGDMDIYNVHYAADEIPKCKSSDNLFAINIGPSAASEFSYKFSVEIPKQNKYSLKSISWKVNDELLVQKDDNIVYDFKNPNNYKISANIIVYCDTCSTLLAMCAEKEISLGPTIYIKDPLIVKKNNPIKHEIVTVKKKNNINNFAIGELNNNQLNIIGWNTNPEYFEYNKYSLQEDTKTVLDQNISVLKKNKNLSLVISGYADSRGDADYNKNLSLKRANSVKQYFIQKGIPQKRISTNAYGETMIKNGCVDGVVCSEEQHQLNRKVDFKVISNNKLITSASLKR